MIKIQALEIIGESVKYVFLLIARRKKIGSSGLRRNPKEATFKLD
jgi:multisubunit Na+/H+ antiporter MnhC subunit